MPFGALVGAGLIAPGEKVYSKDRNRSAVVRADGHLQDGADIASIHELGAVSRYNGWAHWFVERGGKLVSIDTLRETYRRQAVRPVITLPRRAA